MTDRRADRAVRPPVGEAKRIAGSPPLLGSSHATDIAMASTDAREPTLVRHGRLLRVQPGAPLDRRAVGAPALGQVSASRVDRPG